jgi:hypothetical protein
MGWGKGKFVLVKMGRIPMGQVLTRMGWAPALGRVGLVPDCMGGDLDLMGSVRINMVVSGKNRLGSTEE